MVLFWELNKSSVRTTTLFTSPRNKRELVDQVYRSWVFLLLNRIKFSKRSQSVLHHRNLPTLQLNAVISEIHRKRVPLLEYCILIISHLSVILLALVHLGLSSLGGAIIYYIAFLVVVIMVK